MCQKTESLHITVICMLIDNDHIDLHVFFILNEFIFANFWWGLNHMKWFCVANPKLRFFSCRFSIWCFCWTRCFKRIGNLLINRGCIKRWVWWPLWLNQHADGKCSGMGDAVHRYVLGVFFVEFIIISDHDIESSHIPLSLKSGGWGNIKG